jgi:hypothetical protein
VRQDVKREHGLDKHIHRVLMEASHMIFPLEPLKRLRPLERLKPLRLLKPLR